jgi:hypothetical protein
MQCNAISFVIYHVAAAFGSLLVWLFSCHSTSGLWRKGRLPTSAHKIRQENAWLYKVIQCHTISRTYNLIWQGKLKNITCVTGSHRIMMEYYLWSQKNLTRLHRNNNHKENNKHNYSTLQYIKIQWLHMIASDYQLRILDCIRVLLSFLWHIRIIYRNWSRLHVLPANANKRC